MANLLPRLLKEEVLEISTAGISLEEKAPVALLHKKRSNNGQRDKSKKDDTRQKSKKFNGVCYRCGKPGLRFECRSMQEKAVDKGSAVTDNNELLMVKQGDIDRSIDVWLADSGASHHMSPRRDAISRLRRDQR